MVYAGVYIRSERKGGHLLLWCMPEYKFVVEGRGVHIRNKKEGGSPVVCAFSVWAGAVVVIPSAGIWWGRVR